MPLTKHTEHNIKILNNFFRDKNRKKIMLVLMYENVINRDREFSFESYKNHTRTYTHTNTYSQNKVKEIDLEPTNLNKYVECSTESPAHKHTVNVYTFQCL